MRIRSRRSESRRAHRPSAGNGCHGVEHLSAHTIAGACKHAKRSSQAQARADRSKPRSDSDAARVDERPAFDEASPSVRRSQSRRSFAARFSNTSCKDAGTARTNQPDQIIGVAAAPADLSMIEAIESGHRGRFTRDGQMELAAAGQHVGHSRRSPGSVCGVALQIGGHEAPRHHPFCSAAKTAVRREDGESWSAANLALTSPR
jgi:hypothetical protein